MNDVIAAQEALRDAIRAVPGVRAYIEMGDNVDPPAVLVGPPSLAWSTYCSDGMPNTATFLVIVMVAVQSRAVEKLLNLVPLVANAIEGVDRAVVRTASPGTYMTAAATELPSYEITVEVGL